MQLRPSAVQRRSLLSAGLAALAESAVSGFAAAGSRAGSPDGAAAAGGAAAASGGSAAGSEAAGAAGTCDGVSILFSGAWASAAATTAGAEVEVEAGGAPASCARPGVAASAARTTIWKRRTGNPSSCIGSAIAKPRAKVNLGAGFPDISNPVPWADRRPPLPVRRLCPQPTKSAGFRRPSCPRAACPPSCRPSRPLSGLCARPCPRPSRPP